MGSIVYAYLDLTTHMLLILTDQKMLKINILTNVRHDLCSLESFLNAVKVDSYLYTLRAG
jgi:hypothetical protein